MCQLLQRGQRVDGMNGISRQIETRQTRQVDDGTDIADGVVGEIEKLQFSQSRKRCQLL